MSERGTDVGGVYDRRSRPRASSDSERVDGRERALFDPVVTPIESGVTLVEASAGTGKTFCITLTVLRLLLERENGAYRVGDIGRVLVVTFTNAATDELITRVRAALRDAVDVFAGVITERTERTEPLFALLERHGAGELPRLREALSRLDELSIFTIHGFCKRVLEESALESGTAYGAEFVEDDTELVLRAAQDWWRRTLFENELLAGIAVGEELELDGMVEVFRQWRRHPDTRLLPPGDTLDAAIAVLREACDAARAVWDAERLVNLLDAVPWYSKSPLVSAGDRASIVAALAALFDGDLAGGVPAVRLCTTGSVLHPEKGVQRKGREMVEGEPFFAACDRIADALDALAAALRRSFIAEVNDACEAEKRRRHALGFDDLLRRLRDALAREGSDGALARAIRGRWDAALIDEFQDTDTFQYPIFTTAFAGRPLFLIGDPKQAIYAFRGADVYTYLRAAEDASRRYTLDRNWRSTPALVRATNALFGRVPRPFLESEARIPFVRVESARPEPGPLADDGAPLRWWFIPPVPDGKDGRTLKCVGKGDARERFARATAREIVRLLSLRKNGAPLVRPGGIAILVRGNKDAPPMQEALRALGVPSIISGAGDILDSAEMEELERVLAAVAEPRDARLVRAALATELWGLDAGRIHALSRPEAEPEWQRIVDELLDARDAWVRHGFMRMVQALLARLRAPERLLRYEDGERRLTNLRHAVELLHAAATEEHLSPEGLLAWIARERAAAQRNSDRDQLRLESDADAVQIVTIHKSKGLEYDVVFCTALWDSRVPAAGAPVLAHEADGSVVYDHGSADWAVHRDRALAEQLAEDLRLAYVAITRARYRCYVGWGAIEGRKAGSGACGSALGYLLRPGIEVDAAEPVALALAVRAALGESLPEWRAALDALVESCGGTMDVHELDVEDPPPEPWRPDREVAPELRARRFAPAAGQLDTWRVVSYTHLARGRHGSDDDGRDVADPDAASEESVLLPAGFNAFPRGRRAGVALHEIFERMRFAAAAAPETRALVSEVLSRERLIARTDGTVDATVDDVLAMLRDVTSSPLPGAGFPLRDVPREACLAEWTFHLPLSRITRRRLEAVFESEGDGSAAGAYARHIRALEPVDVHGFLTGVVDLAFERDGRWYLVDWKSNYLGPSPGDYDRPALEREMFANHYTLQYHLYVLALHRFLRTRLAAYDYDTHFGGLWYVFLRGVDGASERGWYHDRPSRGLVEALDAALVLEALA